MEMSAQVGAVPTGVGRLESGTRAPAPVPVSRALEPVLGNGLRRGSVVSVAGPAAGSLGLALMAEASSAGGWCAVVGVPELGMVAAAAMGIEPARLVLVDDPGQRWPEVVAALMEGVEVVLLRPGGRPDPTVARRLTALARRHGSVLVSAGAWEGAHVRLQVREASWIGVGDGHGHLRGRQALIHAEGRGAAGPGRQAWVWLPDPDGHITAATPTRLEATDDSGLTTTAPDPVHYPLAVAT
ncbi:hypothetical protein GCM10009780_05260 [Actinomadura alba]